jgi:hypothetical protein
MSYTAHQLLASATGEDQLTKDIRDWLVSSSMGNAPDLPDERTLRVLFDAVMDKAGNAELTADDYVAAITWLHEQRRRFC